MGELRTRKRGKTWEWSFEGARIGGKRNPISKGGFRTKAEALAAGTQAKAEYDNGGRVFKPSEISVADYLDYWIENHVRKSFEYDTQLSYEGVVKNHIKPGLGHYKLASIGPDNIQSWINSKKDCGFSKGMLSGLLVCLSSAMNYAVTPCAYIKINPCMGVRIGKVPETQYQRTHGEYVVPKDEFKRIIERFDPSTNFYVMLMTSYHLGTRIGETYGIDLLGDVDFESGTITIRNQMRNKHGIWYYKPPKYDSVRTIKMGDTLSGILKQEIKQRKINQLRFGEYFIRSFRKPNGELFQARGTDTYPFTEIMPLSVRESGEILTPNSFKYCARVVHNELGNPLFHSHCLRHTHGTILAEKGINPKTVMERLGHKNIQTTLQTYTFNTDVMQQVAIDRFEEYIG